MKDKRHIKRFNESGEHENLNNELSKEETSSILPDFSDNKKLTEIIKSEIKACFENTVLCARSNPPQESYQYAEKMANYVIRLIEGE